MRPSLPALVIALFAPLAVQCQPLEIQFRSIGGAQLDELNVEATSLHPGPGGPKIARWSRPNRSQEPAVLALDREVAWRISVTGPSIWAGELEVNPSERPQRLEVPVYPAGLVTGRLVTQERDPTDRLIARFSLQPPEPGRGKPVEGSSTCMVDEGRFWCTVPTGLLDLSLRVAGHIPHYLWAFSLGSASTRDLGSLKLRRGASVVGRVELVDGSVVQPNCTVTLSPLLDTQRTPPKLTVQSEMLKHTASPNARGFFQFEGISPGSYVLRGQQGPNKSAEHFPIRVVAESETLLPTPVLLQPPLTLRVEVEPPADPGGLPWTIELLRPVPPQGRLESVRVLRAGAQGQADVAQLDPGRYLVKISNSQGAGLAVREVHLSPVENVVSIALDLVVVEGEVRLGDLPLPAHLWFGGRNALPSIEVVSDADGRFTGVLPRTGSWRVDLVADSPPLERRWKAVEVQPSPETGIARLRLTLPDTVLEGRVVDARLEAVEEARVMLLDGSTTMTTHSDERGEFSFRGLDPGSVLLRASTATAQSEDVSATIQGGSPGPTIELMVLDNRVVTGSIASTSGPLPGVRILGLPLVGSSFSFGGAEVASDAEGRFSLELLHQATDLQVVAFPIGFPLIISRARLQPDSQINLLAGGEAGRLQLDFGQPGPSAGPQRSPMVVYFEGMAVDLQALLQWAHMNGVSPQGSAPLEIPQMPSGSYELCALPVLATDPGRAFSTLAPGQQTRCQRGYLNGGSTLVLRLGGKDNEDDAASGVAGN